ncbi:MAG TPA: DNA-processing protein DprA [Solirubrobacteraceae bacterium]
MTACDDCLRRTDLIAAIAGRLQVEFKTRGAPARVLALPDDALLAVAAGPGVARRYAGFDPASARRACSDAGLAPVCRCSSAYPRSLLDLPDPPAVLHVLGEPRVLQEPCAVAVVGARRASTYGTEVAHAFGRGLSVARVAVVSGLALGVDSAAHAGALDGPAPTIGVLAGSAHVPYPARGHRLHAEVARRGAVVSELPPGAPAHRWCFVARNRIIAALSAVTVVVQAAERSGSLTTADFAADIGRGVGAVPGQITSRLAAGTNGLIQAGAALVSSVTDVLELLGEPTGGLPAAAARHAIVASVECAGSVPPGWAGLGERVGSVPPGRAALGERAGAGPPRSARLGDCADTGAVGGLPGGALAATDDAGPAGGDAPRRKLVNLRAAGSRSRDLSGVLPPGAPNELAALLAPDPPPSELAGLLAAVEEGRGTLGELAGTPEAARAALAGLGRLERLGFVRRGFGGRWERTA